MTSGLTPTSAASLGRARRRPGAPTPAAGGRAARRRRPPPAAGVTTAVLLATAAAGDGAAAALPFGDETLLQRLLTQLAALGVREAHVITRPAWMDALRPSAAAAGLAVRLRSSADAADDLRALASLARAGEGGLAVMYGDIVTHTEALAGLLADSRVATGILSSTEPTIGSSLAFQTRSVRGRVVSAASAYHAVQAPNASFLGVLKVIPPHRPALAEVADRLVALCGPPLPASWERELASKRGSALEPSVGDEAEAARWVAAAPDDVPSLLLVGLVRSGLHVGVTDLRKLYWARPLSRAATQRAAAEIAHYDADRVLLDSAVKANDSFFTTFFVSPYSKYIARWAARRGLTPNAVTMISLAIGVAAALAFATGERAGLIAGAVLLQLAFTTDCVDGQLARYTRSFSPLGAWLDSIFDRTKEYAVYAGLAIGASRAGDDVWLLAACALALQTVRHAIDFSYPAAQHQMLGSARQPPLEQAHDAGARSRSPAGSEPVTARRARRELTREEIPAPISAWRRLDRRPALRWIKSVIAFPIGERFAAISLTAALATPRTTFVVLLSWGGVAACYTGGGQLLRSLSR